MSSQELRIPLSKDESVSGILDIPDKAIACLVLAHGAGAGMKHPAMEKLSKTLNAQGVATLRYLFPYMEKGQKRPDFPPVAAGAVAAAVEFAKVKTPKLPIYAGGKSFGGRMTTTAASQGKLGEIQGIICFSFPLHRPKEPSTERAAHLKEISLPMLWIQGTRDDLADLKLLKKVAKANKTITLHIVAGADHSYGVLKSSGRKSDDVYEEVARAVFKWISEKTNPRTRGN